MHQLTALQNERDQWVLDNFPGDALEHSILGATEEIGELAHHWLKLKQGIRGDTPTHVEGMLDAVADCVIYLAGICSHLGADYGQLVDDTWSVVKERDWVNHPQDGGEE